MPNWCENSLTVRGPKKALDAFKETLKIKVKDLEEGDDSFSFAQTVPPPANMITGSISMEAMADAAKKGIPTWYDWQIANWGTKWDACDPMVDVEDKKVTITFQTAWAPPKEWMKSASEKFPELTFEIACCECGAAYFGTICAINGEVDENINQFSSRATNKEGEPIGPLKKFLEKHGIGMGG